MFPHGSLLAFMHCRPFSEADSKRMEPHGLMCLPPAGRCESADEDKPGEAAELGEDRIWLKACSGFIRTRYRDSNLNASRTFN